MRGQERSAVWAVRLRQVKRFRVSMRVRFGACVCVGGCVGAEKRRGIMTERGGRDIEWESREKDGGRGGRRLVQVGGTIWWLMVVRYTDSLQMPSRPLMVFY